MKYKAGLSSTLSQKAANDAVQLLLEDPSLVDYNSYHDQLESRRKQLDTRA